MTPAAIAPRRGKPVVVVLAGRSLFLSFFGAAERRRLASRFTWVRVGG